VRQFGAGPEIYGQWEIHQPVIPHIHDEIGGCWDLKAYACDHSAAVSSLSESLLPHEENPLKLV
jgi:hypothetical protein